MACLVVRHRASRRITPTPLLLAPLSRVLTLANHIVRFVLVASLAVVQDAQGSGEGSDRCEVGTAQEPVRAVPYTEGVRVIQHEW